MDLQEVEQRFLADLTPFLDALDRGIAKAAEFAEANKRAEDAVIAMAGTVSDAAVTVGADMDSMARSAKNAADAMAGVSGAADAAAAGEGHLRDESAALAGILDATGRAADSLAAQTGLLDAGFSGLGNRLDDVNAHLAAVDGGIGILDARMDDAIAHITATTIATASLRDALRGTAGASAAAGTAASRSGAAARDAGESYRIWFTGVRVSATAMHALISGAIDFAAVLIPAAVAAGAWAAVWSRGAVEAYDHLNALRIAADATQNMLGVTAGQALGLSGAFRQAQDAAKPQVFEALGTTLDIVSHSAGNLATAGLQVGAVFDQFLAKLDAEMQSSGGQVSGLLSGMVTDLVQLGQVVGNVGHAIATLAGKMPGAAAVLLDVVDAASRFLVVIADLPKPIIETYFALHELNVWGSVAVGILGRLGLASVELEGSFMGVGRAVGILRNVLGVVPMAITRIGDATAAAGTALTTFGRNAEAALTGTSALGEAGAATGAGVAAMGEEVAGAGEALAGFGVDAGVAVAGLSGGWIIAIAAAVAALGYLTYKLATAKSGAEQFADALNENVAKASSVQSLGAIGAALESVSDHLAVARQQASSFLETAEKSMGGFQQARQTASDIAVLTGEQKKLADQFVVTEGHAASLARTYGTSLPGALMIADQAGVKLQNDLSSQQWAVAQLQIQGYVRGLAAMGQGAGAVGADTTALAIQAGLAATKVDQLNQAWDQFMQNATGGTAGLSSFITTLGSIGQVASGVKNKYGQAVGQMTLSTGQFARALTSFKGTGAAAWANWSQMLGSTAPQMIDWLRTAGAEGALTGKQFSQGVLDMASSLEPLAAKSKTAQSQLVDLAQQAGLNITTFPQLQAAIKNSGASAAGLAKIVDSATIAMGNMGQIAQNLSTVLNTQVTAAMASAALKAYGFSGAVSALAQAIKTYGANSPQAQAAAANLNSIMSKVNKTLADVPGLVANAQAAIDAMHGKTIYMNTIFSSSGGAPLYGQGAPGHQKLASGGTAQRGLAMVGEQGPELMWMRGGEHVLPAGPTAALMKLAGAVPQAHGYAGGTSDFTKLLHLLEKDFRLIENGLRVHLKGPAGVWFPSIAKAVEDIRRDFKKHLISQQEELKLLHLAEARNKRLEGIAARHAESRDLTALANLFAPKHHATKLIGPIADLMKQVEREHGAGVIGKAQEGRLVRQLRHDNWKLTELERDRSRILDRLKKAESSYLSKVAAERQYAASVTSSAESSASLSTIMGGQSGPVSSSYLLASMRIDETQITRFDRDIRKLEKLGLDRNLLNQIIQMGPAQGDQVAQALINGPLANIKAMNATESHIVSSSRHLGQSTSREMYAAGIDAAKGLVNGLKHEQKQIDKIMERVARDMVKALRRELRAHSPSEAAREIGRDFMDGIPLGVADRLPSLDSSLRTAAGHVTSSLRSAAGSGGGATVLDLTIPVTLEVDGKVLFKSVQTQSLRVDRRNSDNRLAVPRGRG